MQFKKSAGVFLTGLILSVVGGVGASMAASAAAAASLAASLSRYASPNSSAAVMAFIFGLLSLVGFILLCMGAYRALVKIDALPVPAPEPAPEAPLRPVVVAE
jgi:putative copper export protein